MKTTVEAATSAAEMSVTKVKENKFIFLRYDGK